MSISRLLAAALFAATLALAQLPIEQTVDELFKTKELKETALSPDGQRIAWVQPGAQEDSQQIMARELAGSAPPIHITAGRNAHDEHGIAWSPDSGRLAFLSDAESKGQAQLYIAPWKGKARRMTAGPLKGFLAHLQWSPDGKQLALLYTKDAPRTQGALEPAAAPSGEIDSAIFYQRITIVDAATGATKEISPADQYVYEFNWSPDSKQFVYTSAPGPGENNWWIARLYTIDIASGAVKQIVKPDLQITAPRWSPDGKSIAYISGLMSDEGVTGGDIFIVPANGTGTPRDVTPARKGSPSWISWMPSSQRLLFSESVKGSLGVAMLDLASGTTETIWKGDETAASGGLGFAMYDLSLSKDGTQAAVIRSSFVQPPEVWAGPIGKWKQVTHLNDGLKKLWGESRSVEWSSDGFDVQGWLVEPAHYDPSKKYPMVVVIHGGPSSAQKPAWRGAFFNTTTLSEQGYFVFDPNPRGSYGQGAKFTEANRKDFGYGDLRDILSGVDAVLAKYPVDPNRIGVTGWSYGGFMTMWTVTQTNRFKAAVAGAGIADWLSYYGENSIDQWMIPFFGATVYDDPEVYKKSSPITYIKNVKTPTLVVVGERDGECPAPQSYEFWHALKTEGVKTSLVVYPGEGHRFHDREHMRDLMKRTLAWFNDNLK
ncbi:MAG TPA: S9 family peptidase [Bryobacteraceae bacterium]|jgi:dipeptidyl aminopeptidase/acylaminoacyl peptidase